jgi:hypothetical protein
MKQMRKWLQEGADGQNMKNMQKTCLGKKIVYKK